jgi:hypothetical protein
MISQVPLPVKTSYNISKIIRRVQNEINEGRGSYISILKRFCQLDGKGNFIPELTKEVKDAEGKVTKAPTPIVGSYLVKEGEQENLKKAIEEFLDIEIELDCHKINLSEFNDEKVPPAILNLLEPLIVNMEVVK